jgi:hypothetical protein
MSRIWFLGCFVDGDFGGNTETALKALQARRGFGLLQGSFDGGGLTWGMCTDAPWRAGV